MFLGCSDHDRAHAAFNLCLTDNSGHLISGTSLRGQFEEKIQAIIKECRQDGNLILFFSDIHRLVGAGDTGVSDAANLLKPYLLKGDLRCIGTSTVCDYQKYIEKDPSLARGFQVIRVDEPSMDVIRQIVLGTLKNYECHHKVKITEDAADAAIEMSDRYIKDRYLPGKAMSLLDRAASRISLSKEQDKIVARKTVAAIVSEITDIPHEPNSLFKRGPLYQS